MINPDNKPVIRDYESTYNADDCIVFKKNRDAYGDLSNMAAGYPLLVNGYTIKTVEALYQLCRFPHRPDIQQEIIDSPSPMTVKIKSRKYRKHTREDWGLIREDIMYWCLCLKLAQHFEKFGQVLEGTGDLSIVEESNRDRFWGAARDKSNSAIISGENKVGRQLMKLRDWYRSRPDHAKIAIRPQIADLKIMGEEVVNDPEHDLFMKKFYARLAFELELGRGVWDLD